MALDMAVHVTAAPQFQPPYGGRIPFGDGLEKRQQLTFSSCGLQCGDTDFCQGYRSNFGFCCPSSVLTRTAFNYCGPATNCINYGVSSVSDFFYDSTSSIQYCGAARPSCVTYIYTSDSFTQVFCASGQSGTTFFPTTSTAGQSATFLGRTSTDESSSTTSSPPTATVVGRPSDSFTTTGNPTNTAGSSTQSSSPSPTGGSSGLGTGAVAGIAVGAALIGIGLAIGAFFLWRRKKAAKTTTAGTANQNFPPQPPMGNQPPVGGYANTANNTGYYQAQQPYAQVPQGYQGELGTGAPGQDYYKGTYPTNQPPVFELGGGGGGQAPQYHETIAPNSGRQELQG
ncbi:hypothetical protein ABW20_dc0103145 [Dactylellina cionopaga]|nr:hypothetical protein ABW20_dc0103145 [Dactylellina cionopaga]